MELIRDLIKSFAHHEDFCLFDVKHGLFEFEWFNYPYTEHISCLDEYFLEDGGDRNRLLENGGNSVLVPMSEMPIEKIFSWMLLYEKVMKFNGREMNMENCYNSNLSKAMYNPNSSKAMKIKESVMKETSVWLSKKEGRFFDDKEYESAEAKFRKMAETDVVDWYITGSNDTMVKVTLVNYKRGD